MALLAETATGSVLGMNVPDTCIPLLKSMNIEYLKVSQGAASRAQPHLQVAKGDLRGVATLDDEQRRLIRESEKGELVVPVRITDSEVRCSCTGACRKRISSALCSPLPSFPLPTSLRPTP
eukprot:749528-Hanusia_phi.AAC.3